MREFEVRMSDKPRIIVESSEPLNSSLLIYLEKLSVSSWNISCGMVFETLPQYLEEAKKVLVGALFEEKASK